jgi:hypothetical protein
MRANNKFCCKSTVGPLYDSDGSLTTDPMEKTCILQHVFAKNFHVDNGELPNAANERQFSNKFSYIYFTSSRVRAIKKL